MLYTHIASSAVVADFPALARRIANKELVQGADIIVGIHMRLLKEPRPHLVPLEPAAPGPVTVEVSPTAACGGELKEKESTIESKPEKTAGSVSSPSESKARAAPQKSSRDSSKPNFGRGEHH